MNLSWLWGCVTKGYRFYDPINHVIYSRDVVLDDRIEKEQVKNFTQDVSRSIDVNTEAKSHDETNKEKEEQVLSDHENNSHSV